MMMNWMKWHDNSTSGHTSCISFSCASSSQLHTNCSSSSSWCVSAAVAASERTGCWQCRQRQVVCQRFEQKTHYLLNGALSLLSRKRPKISTLKSHPSQSRTSMLYRPSINYYWRRWFYKFKFRSVHSKKHFQVYSYMNACWLILKWWWVTISSTDHFK